MAFTKLSLVLVLVANCVIISRQQEGLGLVPDFYKESCPLLEGIVMNIVKSKVLELPRVAAQLLRLHFHDCFVMVSHFFYLLSPSNAIILKMLIVGVILSPENLRDVMDQCFWIAMVE